MSNEITKKRKRISPFRVKVGCVVARRQRSYEDSTWTPPVAGRDCGLTLFGQQIRCNIPKEYQCQRRILEGEIVGLMNYGTTGLIKADLLIDEHLLSEFPFLKRQDEQLGGKHADLEQRLRGQAKVIVRVKLKNPYEPAGVGLRWVMIKNVPPKLFHISKSTETKKRKRASTMYVGNGNDPDTQQIENWRWLAARYHDMSLYSGQKAEGMAFIGKVTSIESHIDDPGSSSIATVIVEPMVAPEMTISGRQPCHAPYEIFYDADHTHATIKMPIEELIVISRSVSDDENMESMKSPVLEMLHASMSYSFRENAYFRTADQLKSCIPCHRCRRLFVKSELENCSDTGCPLSQPFHLTSWCSSCISDLEASAESLPCCKGECDCRFCTDVRIASADEIFRTTLAHVLQRNETNNVNGILGEMEIAPFGLPSEFIDPDCLPMPAAKPSIRTKVKGSKKATRRISLSAPSATAEPRTAKSTQRNGHETSSRSKKKRKADQTLCIEDYSVFKPTCARLLASSEARPKKGILPRSEAEPAGSIDLPRILRKPRLEIEKEAQDDKKTSASRAARANQRRLMKDVQAFGADILGVDVLAAREPMIRFDRSPIHAWGVAADEEISAGTMIVEYRGEIIGNAMAEKREKEYERAKIGSDYMFRIDKTIVCDATKQGNVARFINHSCSPNCYTKIITSEGSKRIVIYAKTDIAIGEELCYDYKFPLEYDVSKRIPCHCGARDCRGFMNWDKKYVVLERKSDGAGSENRANGNASKSIEDFGNTTAGTEARVDSTVNGDHAKTVEDSPNEEDK